MAEIAFRAMDVQQKRAGLSTGHDKEGESSSLLADATLLGLTPHYRDLKNYFRRRVVREHDADDLTQEAFLRVFGRKKDEVVKEPLRLLYRVARNLLIDRSRRAKVRPSEVSLESEQELAHGASSPAGMAEVQDELVLLRVTIANLPTRCREVFLLSRFEGLSYAEIGAKLGISTKTVENHIGHAIVVCRNALEKR